MRRSLPPSPRSPAASDGPRARGGGLTERRSWRVERRTCEALPSPRLAASSGTDSAPITCRHDGMVARSSSVPVTAAFAPPAAEASVDGGIGDMATYGPVARPSGALAATGGVDRGGVLLPTASIPGVWAPNSRRRAKVPPPPLLPVPPPSPQLPAWVPSEGNAGVAWSGVTKADRGVAPTLRVVAADEAEVTAAVAAVEPPTDKADPAGVALRCSPATAAARSSTLVSAPLPLLPARAALAASAAAMASRATGLGGGVTLTAGSSSSSGGTPGPLGVATKVGMLGATWAAAAMASCARRSGRDMPTHSDTARILHECRTSRRAGEIAAMCAAPP